MVKVVIRRNLLMDFVVREQDNFIARQHLGGEGELLTAEQLHMASTLLLNYVLGQQYSQ